MAYKIQINEYQRKLLLNALLNTDSSKFSKENNTGTGAFESEFDELIIFITMLRGLKRDEENNPGVLHGFCL